MEITYTNQMGNAETVDLDKVRQDTAERWITAPDKIAIMVEQYVESGTLEMTMHYPSGKTFTRYFSQGNRNFAHDGRQEMFVWAEQHGFEVARL